MTVLHLADGGEAADLAAFLSRLIHYDRAAAVRLQAHGKALAVFGRPPSFEVLAIRTARLAKPYENGLDVSLDVTVSAGELLESVDESAATAAVPAAVTGPPWAGVLPPRGAGSRSRGCPRRSRYARWSPLRSPNSGPVRRSWRPRPVPVPNSTGSGGRSGPGRSATPGFRYGPRTRHSRWDSCAPPARVYAKTPPARARWGCTPRGRGSGCVRRTGRSPCAGQDLGRWTSACAEPAHTGDCCAATAVDHP